MKLSLEQVQTLLQSNWPSDLPQGIQIYSQRDIRWKNDLMITNTIGSVGCAMTCCAMLASQFDINVTPQILNKFLRSNNGYTPNNEIYWAKVSELTPQLQFQNYIKWRAIPADMDMVTNELELHPVILQVDFKPVTENYLDTHFVTAIGYTGTDIDIIDPWDGTKTQLLKRYALSNWNLARAIFAMVIYVHKE